MNIIKRLLGDADKVADLMELVSLHARSLEQIAAGRGREDQLAWLAKQHPDFDVERTLRIARSTVRRNSEVFSDGFEAYLEGGYEAWARRMGEQ